LKAKKASSENDWEKSLLTMKLNIIQPIPHQPEFFLEEN